MQASKAFYDNKEDLLQLWVHETFRIIGDRMWDPADLAWLRKQLDERLSSTFSISFAGLFEEFGEQVGVTRCSPVLCLVVQCQPGCCSTVHMIHQVGVINREAWRHLDCLHDTSTGHRLAVLQTDIALLFVVTGASICQLRAVQHGRTSL